MPGSKVSVIIPHWNGIDILSDCLESLSKNTYPNLEIIVVDNASTDASSEWVSLHYPDIKLVQNNKNYGYAGGCNNCLLYTSPSPRDQRGSRMPSSA